MGLSDAAKTRIIMTFTCVQVVVTAAVLYGWPGMLVVLKDEGQYDELCEDTSSSSLSSLGDVSPPPSFASSLASAIGAPTQRGLAKCNAQEVRLNLIFTISFLANALSCLSGIIADNIGPRLSNIVGGVVSCFLHISQARLIVHTHESSLFAVSSVCDGWSGAVDYLRLEGL